MAAVAAVVRDRRKAVSLIEVEYEELPSVQTIMRHWKENLVHEDINEIDHMEGVFFPNPTPILPAGIRQEGDPQKGFEEADHY